MFVCVYVLLKDPRREKEERKKQMGFIKVGRVSTQTTETFANARNPRLLPPF